MTIAIEVDGEACGSLTLQATGLPGPDQPGVAGGFQRMVEDAVQAVDDALRDRASLLPTPPYEWPPTEVPLTDIDTWIVLRGTALEFVPGSC